MGVLGYGSEEDVVGSENEKGWKKGNEDLESGIEQVDGPASAGVVGSGVHLNGVNGTNTGGVSRSVV